MSMIHKNQKETASLSIPNGQTQVTHVFSETYSEPPVVYQECGHVFTDAVITTTQVTFTAKDDAGYNFDIKVVSQSM